VPVLVRMTEETRDKKYLDSAIKAADYVWTAYGNKCVFCGATGGDTADRESGMLSTEAFLALYENTKDAKWLRRAETAGSYAESRIWIWNVPMPVRRHV
jgi:mannose/cellobiose epimerase-like protein (N-acyl-D-glucosamine 2-epimerase family)